LDQNGLPGTAQSASTVLTADFQSIQDNVFTPICSVCHSGATAPQGLRLDADNSYALLVGIPSSEVPSLRRVLAGNPDASYLVQKLTGGAAVGERMPFGGPYLPQSTIDVIRQWIANGAARSATTPSNPAIVTQVLNANSSLGIRVSTTAPLSNALVSESVTQIVIGFDRQLDSNLVNASTVTLKRIDPAQNSVANTDEMALQLLGPTSNPASLVITPSEPLTAGKYLLTLRGTGGGALAGLDALALNAVASNAGSDFTLTFTVQ
jgi:methionine-rich copper-binding protein CopC